MYGLSLIAGLLIFFSYVTTSTVTKISDQQKRADIAVMAGHIAAYGSFLDRYARTNPGASGTISDGVAGLPAWFKRFPDVTNYVNAGTAYLYFVPRSRAEGFAIATKMDTRLMVGMKLAGSLQRSGEAEPAMVLPAEIPDGALVLVL